MSLALGIDVGTSGIRTAIVDECGEVLSMACSMQLPQEPDWVDAEKWWQALATCLLRQVAALINTGRGGTEVSRIAVDGTSGSMVLCDANLRPVGRALMYNSGNFTTEAARIDAHVPPSHMTRGTNSALARVPCILWRKM